MNEYNVEALKEYHEALIKARDNAVAEALSHRQEIINAKLEEARKEIEATVDAEIIAKAEEPFKHDIELCEKFVVVQPTEEVVE